MSGQAGKREEVRTSGNDRDGVRSSRFDNAQSAIIETRFLHFFPVNRKKF